MKANYRIALASTLLFFLLTGCAENAIRIDQGDTFSNNESQFRVLEAKRYSQQYECGDYKCYDDTVFILLEWSCLSPLSGECIVGGYEFSLYDTDKREKISSVTFNTELVSQFEVLKNSYNCCGLSRSGQVGKMYLFFKVPCYRNLVLRYPNDAGESDTDSVYYANLPSGVQCNR